MVNPDDFIFHSSFWYPTNYKEGFISAAGAAVPQDFLLSTEYEPGDYYAAYVEETFPNNDKYVFYRMLGTSFYAHTVGSSLYGFHGAQSVGQTFTGKIHYRIYKKPDKFSFISRGKLEKVLFDISDTLVTGSSIGQIELPSLASEPYYCRGIWRINGGSWYGMGSVTPRGSVNWYYRDDGDTHDKFLGLMFQITGTVPAGSTIDYRVIGIKL